VDTKDKAASKFLAYLDQVGIGDLSVLGVRDVSGFLLRQRHLRRKTVDFKMGIVLLLSGVVGSAGGIWVFARLSAAGQVDLLIQLSYVLFLGLVGAMMLQESVRSLMRKSRPGAAARRSHEHLLVHRLPFKVKFRTSGLYISLIPPVVVGAGVGLLSAIMGVGGGFIMVPAMIYVLGMPTKVVVGTSLFQIIFVSAFTTVMHATTSFSVDMALALLLIIGGVVGAQVGAQVGLRLKAEQLRILLALLVLLVSAKIALDLLLQPAELYSVASGRAG